MASCVRIGLAAGVVLLSGCVHERSKEIVRVPEGALSRGVGGPSTVPPRERVAVERAEKSDGWDALPARSEGVPAGGQAAATMADAVPMTAFISASAEVKTSAAPRAHAKWAPGATAAQMAREKFLNAITTIDAEKVTVYVPAEYAAEVGLVGASVVHDGPGRRTASGSAVLTLRRLTVRARRLTVSVKAESGGDFQVSARGAVSLESDQPSSLLSESGVRQLLLKNDGYVPLR